MMYTVAMHAVYMGQDRERMVPEGYSLVAWSVPFRFVWFCDLCVHICICGTIDCAAKSNEISCKPKFLELRNERLKGAHFHDAWLLHQACLSLLHLESALTLSQLRWPPCSHRRDFEDYDRRFLHGRSRHKRHRLLSDDASFPTRFVAFCAQWMTSLIVVPSLCPVQLLSLHPSSSIHAYSVPLLCFN